MIKPFSQQEINAASDLLQRKMRFFNRRLSGARIEMPEDDGQRPDCPDAGNVVVQNRNSSGQTRKTRGKKKIEIDA